MSKVEEKKKSSFRNLFTGLWKKNTTSESTNTQTAPKKKKDPPKISPSPADVQSIQLGRALTQPSEPSSNHNHDNVEHNLIVRENEMIDNRYRVTKNLGKGVYGIVIQAIDTTPPKRIPMKLNDLKKKVKPAYVAIKIIKNHPLFHRQARVEVSILEELNKKFESNGETSRIVHLRRRFLYRSHLCLVFECLGKNLFELIQWRGYRGLPLPYISLIAKQLLTCLVSLEQGNVIHCDLKPENVLLVNNKVFVKSWSPEKEAKDVMDEMYTDNQTPNYGIKVIDFGSACYEHSTSSWYIQSRFYRAPEVLLGIEYDCKIDLWSFGCIIAELYLGIPLFPGCSAYDQVTKIVDILGTPPGRLIDQGRYSGRFFFAKQDNSGRIKYKMKSERQYSLDTGEEMKGGKNYFKKKNFEVIIMNKEEALVHYPSSTKKRSDAIVVGEEPEGKENEMSPEEIWKLKNENHKQALLDFLKGLLRWDMTKRWTPEQALQHPFITGDEFTKPFKPKYSTFSNDIPIGPPNASYGSPSNRRYLSSSQRRNTYNRNHKQPAGSYYDKPMLGQSPHVSSFQSAGAGGSYDYNSGAFTWFNSPPGQQMDTPFFLKPPLGSQNGGSSLNNNLGVTFGSPGNNPSLNTSFEFASPNISNRKKRSRSMKSRRSSDNNSYGSAHSTPNKMPSSSYSEPAHQKLFDSPPFFGNNNNNSSNNGYTESSFDDSSLRIMQGNTHDGSSNDSTQDTQFFLELNNNNNNNNSNNNGQSTTTPKKKHKRKTKKKKKRGSSYNGKNHRRRSRDNNFSYMSYEEEDQYYSSPNNKYIPPNQQQSKPIPISKNRRSQEQYSYRSGGSHYDHGYFSPDGNKRNSSNNNINNRRSSGNFVPNSWNNNGYGGFMSDGLEGYKGSRFLQEERKRKEHQDGGESKQ